jgi:hypothetical protein
MDDDVPVIRVATDTGGVDTGHTAPAPHTDIAIGDTNNPTDTHGVMPTGPNDGIHVTNSNTDNGEPPSMDDNAASPTLEVGGRKRHITSIDRPADDGHAATANSARADVFPSPKKRRSSCWPAHEARRKAFYDSKEPRTTGAPPTQVGADTKGVDGRGV